MKDKPSIHQFTVNDLTGKAVDLSTYKGKVLLVVNTASQCGFTPQLEGLSELYESYKDKGLEILAFPSNDFNGQEPLEGEAIGDFCQINYGVKFKIFEKTHVKGKEVAPLFHFLANKKENGAINSIPKWNFHKYLVDKNGQVIDYFYSTTTPTASRVKRAIEKLL